MSFQAESTFKGELSARGETALSLNGKTGIDNKGIYNELSLDFGGIVAYLTAKADVGVFSVGIENKAFTIVDEKPDLFNQTFYLVKINNENN